MVNRRFLRIKVMQALYSYFQADDNDPKVYEKNLFHAVEKIHELYFYMLDLLGSIHHNAVQIIEEGKNKHLPRPEELNPNTKFIENKVLLAIVNSKEIQKQIEVRKISWTNDNDLVRKLYNEIRNSEIYKTYMSKPGNSMQEDKAFISEVISEIIAENDLMNFWFEEKNIHWVDDSFVAINTLLKTVELCTESQPLRPAPLFKDPEEDKQFGKDLLHQCILHNAEFEKMISEKTQNWEMDRIASMDVLLMKMALTEILYFENVPIKVSLNEYIEISKQYSTPKSRQFINGILDKIVHELKAGNKIQKSGRGLLEN